MNGHWTVFAQPVICGAGSGFHEVPAGEPVRVVTGAIRRCAAHASVPVDWSAVDAARQVLDARQAAAALAATRQLEPAAITRVRPPRPVRAWTAVGDLFDPKTLAIGDRDT